ncbi:hypothetical protein PYW07_013377 [Mythimna separata]|uniref:C2H2-type domain-containing protein n=1 Tax=Mythimna separata TaxID=271217 RepID=A0AAD7Y6C5_MYTSE|nr:hypothetical protein PYW07_013377 [Mythimna separata]
MEEIREEIITKSNQNSAAEDIVKEHCYFEVNTKTVLFCHLMDHNYFETDSPKPKPKTKPVKKIQKPKRRIKITELRAVYNCKTCGFRTMDRELSAKHNCTKKTNWYVPCTKCDRYKAPEGYLQCTKCSYFTKTKGSLKVHMHIHAKGTPYKCTECDYSGRDLRDLISHFGMVKDLKCECGYTTHVKTKMVAHKRTHTGEKPFVCAICSHATADAAGLYRHLKIHQV